MILGKTAQNHYDIAQLKELRTVFGSKIDPIFKKETFLPKFNHFNHFPNK